MQQIFLLHHTYGESESETYKLLGAFSSREQAQAAIAHYLNLPGFRDYPDSYEISDYVIGRLHWPEGFGFDQTDEIEE